ncbi:hypothetical protein [Sanguibacter antarcticus]|uniref:Uncharacterized protein n=1 Tax=Sanguibacter antarcticus TaxID=372484 RepID=A0A2A9E533_9MICO|nr:hypothetical protein [Sanguibacter antarcticus]PFG33964.1 hypothetical protein ATL42_1863 [Sanguibacter antarcticus]
MKRIALTSALALTVVLASCASPETDAPAAAPTQDATPAAARADSLTGSLNAELGIIAGPDETDEHGTYSGAVLSPDSPLLAVDLTKASGSSLTAEDLRGAVDFTTTFIIENGFDGPMLYDSSDTAREAWTETVLPSYTENARAPITDETRSGTDSSANTSSDGWMDEEPGFAPAPYDGVRLSVRQLDLETVMDGGSDGDVVVEYRYEIVQSLISEGEEILRVVWGDQSYTVVQEDGWKIDNWSADRTSQLMDPDVYDAYATDGTVPEGSDLEARTASLDAFSRVALTGFDLSQRSNMIAD